MHDFMHLLCTHLFLFLSPHPVGLQLHYAFGLSVCLLDVVSKYVQQASRQRHSLSGLPLASSFNLRNKDLFIMPTAKMPF